MNLFLSRSDDFYTGIAFCRFYYIDIFAFWQIKPGTFSE